MSTPNQFPRAAVAALRRPRPEARTLLLLAGLLAMMMSLAACHTTAGVGQDVSATGDALTGAAKKATP